MLPLELFLKWHTAGLLADGRARGGCTPSVARLGAPWNATRVLFRRTFDHMMTFGPSHWQTSNAISSSIGGTLQALQGSHDDAGAQHAKSAHDSIRARSGSPVGAKGILEVAIALDSHHSDRRRGSVLLHETAAHIVARSMSPQAQDPVKDLVSRARAGNFEGMSYVRNGSRGYSHGGGGCQGGFSCGGLSRQDSRPPRATSEVRL